MKQGYKNSVFLIKSSLMQLFGRGSALIVGLISVPIYLSYLGAEKYGVVGIYISLQTLLCIIDFGLPTSANRQIAIMQNERKSATQIFSLIRSFEILFFCIAIME